MNIIVYGRADGMCLGCTQLKEFLDINEITYDFRDIGSADVVKRVEYKKQLMAKKISSIPYMEISGHGIIGFNEVSKKEISEILGISIDE